MGRGEAGNGYHPTRLSLVAGESREERRAAKRAKPTPPQAHLGRKGGREPGEGSERARKEPRADAGKHQTDMEAKQAAFTASRPQSVRDFLANVPEIKAMRDRRCTALHGEAQKAVDQTVAALLATPCSNCGEAVGVQRDREVEVVDSECRYVLKVPVLKCGNLACLSPPFSVHPSAAYCAATTATIDCRKWLTFPVVIHFSELNFSGVSGFAYSQGLDALDRFMKPRGSVLQQAAVSSHSAPLKSEQLITAAQEHCKVMHEASLMPVVGKDCFGGCFVCASTGRTKLNDETPVPSDFKVAVSTDAMCSANHFATAGSAQKRIKPSTSMYLGEVAQRLLDDRAAGAAAPPAATAALPRSAPECTVALTCNRERSTATRAELDCYGMVAAVCSHTIPCLGLALAMTTHEQHSFYQRILTELLEIRSDVKFIYLDLMCRFADKVDAVIEDLQRRNVLPQGDDVKPMLLLPMMHAFDHNRACQRQYNPVLQDGTGRRVGEQTEQFWSLTKPFSKIGRYMSWHRWWDGMNLLFWAITLRAQANFPSMLRGRIKNTIKKLASSVSELENLKVEAGNAGVPDLDAALQLADSEIERDSVKLSGLGRLVHAMIKLRSMNGIIVHKAGFTLLMPDHVAIPASRVANEEAKAALVRVITELRINLIGQNILPIDYSAALPETSAEYAQGLAEVRLDTVQSMRASVENQVVKRKHILRSLQRAEGSKNAAPLNRGLNRAKEDITRLVQAMPTWEVLGTDRNPAWQATDEVIDKIMEGEYPWVHEDASGGAAEPLQRHFGERYRIAAAQVARAKEEIEFLKMEEVLLVNGLEERIEKADEAIQRDQELAAAERAAGNTRQAKVCAGRSELRVMERERLEMIKEEAVKLRAENLLGAY